MPAEPHVFVSYSHDSEAHREHVVQLVQQLRAGGVNVWFDRFEVEPPSEGWPQWLERQVALATRILVVCTETFRKQFEGDALGGIGWESYALRNALAHGAKLIPVLLEGGSSQHVPRELRALTAFYLPEQLPQLLYRLGISPDMKGKPAAALPVLPVSSQVADLSQSTPSRRISNFGLLGDPNFVGREAAMAQLKETLHAPRLGGSWEPQVILGVAGVGRTRLALEYAYRQQEEYDLLWLVRVTDATSIAAAYSDMARELALTSTEVTDAERVQAMRTWLAEHDRWLLIFDECRSAEIFRPFLPPSPRGHVIATSRIGNWQGPGKRHELGPLARAESVELLMRTSGHSEAAGAERLAATLGDLPLALSIAGSVADVTAADFVAIQNQVAAQLVEAGKPSSTAAPVAASFAAALAAARKSHAAAGPLFDVLAYCAPAPVPLSLFRDNAAFLRGALRDAARDGHELEALFRDLRRIGIVAIEEPDMHLHPEAQRAMLALVAAPGPPTAGAVRAPLALLAVAFPSADDPSTWERADRLLPHARAVLADPLIDREAPTEAHRLLARVGDYLRVRSEVPAALAYQRRALAIAERHLADDVPAIVSALTALAATLVEMGDETDEGPALIRRALVLAQATTGNTLPTEPHLVPLYRQAALVYALEGDEARARSLIELAASLMLAAHGTDAHLAMAETLSLHAWIESRFGKHESAVRRLEQALAIQRQLIGHDDHPVVAGTLRYLGQFHQNWGQLPAARGQFERALAAARAGGDPASRLAIAIEIDLAGVLRLEGDLVGARRALEEALDAARGSYGSDANVEGASIMSNLGQVLISAGDAVGALRHLDRAIEILQAMPDQQHRLGAAFELRAEALRTVGSLAQARADLEWAIASLAARSGMPTAKSVQATRKLATVIREQHHIEEARAILERGLAITLEHLGSDHPEHVHHLFELAMVAVAEQRGEDARALLEQAIAHGRRILGQENVTIASAESALALELKQLGRLEEAWQHASVAWELYVTILGPKHRYVGAMHMMKAEIEVMRERWDDAADEARRAADLFIEAGETASEARAQLGLAFALRRKDRLVDAALAYQRTLTLADAPSHQRSPTVAEPTPPHEDMLKLIPVARDGLLQLVELMGEREPFDAVKAVEFLARTAPAWLSEQLCADVQPGSLTIGPMLLLRIKLRHPCAAAAVARIERTMEAPFGWVFDLAAIKGEGAAVLTESFPATRVLNDGLVELSTDVSGLPGGVYLLTIRFVAKGRDVWRTDITISTVDGGNPFVAGPPVLNPERFFGRRQLLTDLREQLESASIALLGPRRSGKTSVLYRLREQCAPDWTVALADLHAFSGDDVRALLTGIADEVAAAAKISVDAAALRPFEALRRALRDAGVHKVLLLLDEVRVLADHPDAAFQLRAMSKWTEPVVRLVVAGTSRDLDRVSVATFDQRGSSPLNELVNHGLDMLMRDEALALLQPPALPYRYEPAALERLLELGAGRPFFLNLLAYLTIDAVRQESVRTVTVAHVDAARAEAVSYLDRWFREFLTELDDAAYAALPDLVAADARLAGPHREALRSAGITIGPRRDLHLDPIFADWWSAGGRRR